ncbi:Cobalt transport protein CbiM [ANME-1 cluster archaeon GoMg1]|nr:Cobalt transport protein CbiM [ANME-1 cluster archaeon GoMg1]
MHISDGVLSAPVLAAGWIITAIFIALAIWWSKKKGIEVEMIPKLSVMTAVFFVVCLVHIPIGPTCVHFMLDGLLGIMLGILSYPAFFIGLVLQAFLFQFGGVTTIGINTVNVGIPALIAYVIFQRGMKSELLSSRRGFSAGVFGAIAGGVAVLLVAVFTAGALIASGEQFTGVAVALVVTHIPVMIIEAAVVGSVVAFLARVKPELIGNLGGDKK